jgi:hypothetical protein
MQYLSVLGCISLVVTLGVEVKAVFLESKNEFSSHERASSSSGLPVLPEAESTL